MSSAISVPVIIAISSGAGLIVIASTAVVVFLVVHRRRSDRLANVKQNGATATRDERRLHVRQSFEIGDSPPSKRPAPALFRAFSEKTFKTSPQRIDDEPLPRIRNVLQRKRYADGRSCSLPVFSIVAPRIPSPTLSIGRQSSLFEDGESYMLQPMTDSATATVGGSCTSFADQWPLPAQGSGVVQNDPLRPAPLFQGHARSLSGHPIPSAHPPRTTSNMQPQPMQGQLQPRFYENPTLKRFTSLQQIGRAPTGALPTPPPGYVPLFREGKVQRADSRSPRPRSMESLISGTSSILRSTSSPVAGRKRSATDAYQIMTAPKPAEAKPNIVPRSPGHRNGRQFASRNSSRSSRGTKNLQRTGPLDDIGVTECLLPRNKSSALSVALVNTPIPQVEEESEQGASPKKARHSPASKKSDHCDPPAVLNPSPRRPVRGYRLLQDPEAAANASLFKDAEKALRGRKSQDSFNSKEASRRSDSRPVKPFISHLPRSPRPEDRPVGIRLAPRLHTESNRDSPIQRVLPPGAEQDQLIASSSENSLQSTPPRSRLRESGLSDPRPVAPRVVEPVACGDLASHLRRMDSYCDADDNAGYFNLTGGTCTSPHDAASPWSERSAHRISGMQESSSPDLPVRVLSTRTSGFYTPGELPEDFPAIQSSPPSLDQAPSLTPNNSSSSPYPDEVWVKGGSSARSGGGSVGGLGLGLAGQFNITANGLNFSPSGSPCTTPSPSPPPRSALRNTLLAEVNDPLVEGILLEPEHSPDVQKADQLDGEQARELGIVGSSETALSLRKREEPWGFRGLLAAREAEERSAELSRDMQLAAQQSRRDLHEIGYPLEARDRRSLRVPSPEEMPGMAF